MNKAVIIPSISVLCYNNSEGNRMARLKNLFNSLAGQLPVIGPHANIEARLLLAGKKPLGWVLVEPDELVFDNPSAQAEHEARKGLDEAVRAGKIIAEDVLVYRLSDANGVVRERSEPLNFRHYCQPGHEKDLEAVVAYNRKAFNHEEPDGSLLKKDFGEYLGYRKRDIKLWYSGTPLPMRGLIRFALAHIKNVRLHKTIAGIVGDTSRFIQSVAQPAYHQKLLHQIDKEQKKAARKTLKNPAAPKA